MTRGGNSLFLIQGPITVAFTPSETKILTDLTLNNDKRLATNFIFQDHKQVVSIRFYQQQQAVIVVEWNIKLGSSQGSKASLQVVLPKFIDGKINVMKNENVIHLTTNALLLPNTDFMRRVKAFTDLNMDSKQWQATFSWDADRDQSKKASIQAQVVRYSTRPPQATIQ